MLSNLVLGLVTIKQILRLDPNIPQFSTWEVIFPYILYVLNLETPCPLDVQIFQFSEPYPVQAAIAECHRLNGLQTTEMYF